MILCNDNIPSFCSFQNSLSINRLYRVHVYNHYIFFIIFFYFFCCFHRIFNNNS